MNRKKLIIITIVLVMLILVAFLVYFLFFKGEKTEPTGVNSGINSPGQTLPGDTNQPGDVQQLGNNGIKPVVTQADVEQTEIKNRAKFFVEMMGSYSPEALFRNVTELRPLMTENMKQWSDDFIARNLPNIEQSQERVTTKAMKTEILNYNTSRTTVLVYVRRDKTNRDEHKLYNQEVEVKMVKAGEEWLADEVMWK